MPGFQARIAGQLWLMVLDLRGVDVVWLWKPAQTESTPARLAGVKLGKPDLQLLTKTSMHCMFKRWEDFISGKMRALASTSACLPGLNEMVSCLVLS